MTKLLEQLKGQRVTHIFPSGKPGSYGKGTIADIQQKDNIQVSVRFDDAENVKTFIYPDCFGKFLKLEDHELEEKLHEINACVDACIDIKKKRSSPAPAEKAAANSDKESPADILKELDSMVGLGEIKQDIRGLTDFITVNNLRRDRGMKTTVTSKHLVLTGAPGTGKTTVAHLIARIYYSIGAIPQNKFVETGRAELVAGYVGQTAIKTQNVIDSALGGVLFIDEAYSLISHSSNDYGSEAVATLIRAMENQRDNLVVIVAGYENEMKEFINSNPGLSSRFTRYLNFKDYSADELMLIFYQFCDDNEYMLEDKAAGLLQEYFENIYNCRGAEFGNARAVRNIFESIVTHQAERLMAMGRIDEIDDDTLISLTEADVRNAVSKIA